MQAFSFKIKIIKPKGKLWYAKINYLIITPNNAFSFF